jgi:type II secretory pathway pseudopilin PulG
VELLVVIAIIGILIAMLLPAVQAAREAARRSQCTNNLKEIALAIHNYHDTHLRFPSGNIVAFPGTGPTDPLQFEPAWGWGSLILPYLEQAPLYHRLNVGKVLLRSVILANPQTPIVPNPAQTTLTVFRCPSDVGPPLHTMGPFTQGGGNEAVDFVDVLLAVSNYFAAFGQNSAVNNPVNVQRYFTGGFGFNSKTRMGDVRDGASNTIMLGERAWELRGQHFGAGVWAGCAEGFSADCHDDIFVTLRGPINGGAAVNTRRESLSSTHAGGIQVALYDASVRFISENIEFRTAPGAAPCEGVNGCIDSTLERLMGIKDGQAVGEF